MSDMLQIGYTGVRAYQTALTTVSENIANAGTAGYTRRTTNMNEMVVANKTSQLNGLGVNVASITRSADNYRSQQIRATGGDLARTEAGATWLDRIETSLTSYKLGDRLTAFFNATKQVAADPSAAPPRAAMLESAASLAAAFTGTGQALARAADELDASMQASVDQLNGLLTSLAATNSGLGNARAGTSGQLALLDQRDRLLEQIGTIADVTTAFDDAGRVTVRAGGATGPVMLTGAVTTTLTFVRNDEGAVSFALHNGAAIQSITPMSGALAGLAEGAQKIADARATIDDYATAFVEGVNAVQAAGQDLAGATGAAMFAQGGSPSQLSLLLTDPSAIAAAAPAAGPRDNSNLAGFDALRASGNFEGKLSDQITANAGALSGKRAVAEAQSAIRDHAVNERDSMGAVNIDEEAVDMMRFQQAYQASSRVIKVAGDLLDALLAIK